MSNFKGRIIPILLHDKRGLVKTRGFKNPVYIGDPINSIRIFNEKYVDELVFLDIGRTRDGLGPDLDLVSRIAQECFMPLGYGGGIRNLQDAKDLFSCGVEKVILQNAALKNLKLVAEIAEFGGSQSIAISLDFKRRAREKYELFTQNSGVDKNLSLETILLDLQKHGAGEVIITSVDHEGSMSGYDLELIRKIRSLVSIPIVANGGAGKLTDFEQVFDAGADAAAAGSMFVFIGKLRGVLINYPTSRD
jgi:imidazole glycerol-phosphate synthase subunit HisF